MVVALSVAWFLLQLRSDHRLIDANPGARWFVIAVLVSLPFVVILAVRLMGGNLESREIFPPVALIAAGAIIISGGVFMLLTAWRDHADTVDDGVGALLLGSWAIRFGMSKRKRSTSAHGSTR